MKVSGSVSVNKKKMVSEENFVIVCNDLLSLETKIKVLGQRITELEKKSKQIAPICVTPRKITPTKTIPQKDIEHYQRYSI